MAKLNGEFFDKIAANIIEKGESDDLAKFMLSGEEHIAAVQRYFNYLEADKKERLTLRDDEWFLGIDEFQNPFTKQKYNGLALFKLVSPSIIPHVEHLYIANIQLDSYSFLGDIKNLHSLELQFSNEEHIKFLLALSNLQTVDQLWLKIKNVNLQLLSSFHFSFNDLYAFNFIFETNPNSDKVFQATSVWLYGDEEVMNDFVFTRQNYQNYVAIFPNARDFHFKFYIKIADDISDLLKVSNVNHADEVKVPNRDIEMEYKFFDYSGYPESKVMEIIEDDEDWNTINCPYADATVEDYPVEVTCRFPLAIAEIGNILAQQPLRRIPDNSNGNPEDYYRLTIRNRWSHKAEFEVLKTASVESLLQVYAEITGMDHEYLWFANVVDDWGSYDNLISDEGTVADTFQDGDVVFIVID